MGLFVGESGLGDSPALWKLPAPPLPVEYGILANQGGSIEMGRGGALGFVWISGEVL